MLSVLCAAPVLAGGLDDVARLFERNRQQLRDYVWTSTTEIALEGERPTVERYEVRVDENGVQRRTTVPSAAGRGRKAGKRQRQAEELHDSLRSLVESYVHPAPETTRTLFADPFVWRGEGRIEGVTRLQARNVVREGDQVSLWLETATERPTKLEILTSSGGEPVRVTTEFARIDQGPFYPARIVMETEIKEKRLVVTTANADYRRAERASP